mmetsp:Transcript_9687/g.17694  ORF Transcript_9687/g.17694 Transcript_9687/m.17694 type:complete len:212 (-) Transcript_9687:914-1549(-)
MTPSRRAFVRIIFLEAIHPAMSLAKSTSIMGRRSDILTGSNVQSLHPNSLVNSRLAVSLSWLNFSKSKPFHFRALVIRSSLSDCMRVMNWVPSRGITFPDGFRSRFASALNSSAFSDRRRVPRISDTNTSTLPCLSCFASISVDIAFTTDILSCSPFLTMFIIATFARGLLASIPVTCFAPSDPQIIESRPEPIPISTRVVSSLMTCLSAS